MKAKRKYTKRAKVDPVPVAPVVEVPQAAPAQDPVVAHNKQFEYNPSMRKPTPYKHGEGGAHAFKLEVFASAASKGGFVAYDGDGYYADDNNYDSDASVWVVSKPDWATKVVWFNK